MIKKLRTKFIAFTMILVTLMLGAIFVTVYTITADNLKEESLRQIRNLADHPFQEKPEDGGLDKGPGEDTPPKKDDRDGKDRPDNDKPFRVREAYLILEQTDQGVWSAQGSDYFDLTDQAYLNALLQEVTASGEASGVLAQYSLRYLRTDTPDLQYTFLDITQEQLTLRQLVQTFVIIGVISLVVFFGIALLLAKLAIGPVEKAWKDQKQFIADASHELKTPLAVILTNAELINDPNYSPQEREQFSRNVLYKARQMRKLVEELLQLARLDKVSPDTQPVELSTITENALLPFEPVFYEAGLSLQSTVTPGLWVRGNSQHLQQVVEIFLDNALKYADPGTVQITLHRAGCHALLRVENPGTPLSDREARDIFLRFYRTDTARNSGSSFGLGLSIAQSIVQQYGGKIWAEGTQTGNRFCAMFPLCGKDSQEIPHLNE